MSKVLNLNRQGMPKINVFIVVLRTVRNLNNTLTAYVEKFLVRDGRKIFNMTDHGSG